MKESIYKSYDELPLFLNATTVAKLLGISPSSCYELMHVPIQDAVDYYDKQQMIQLQMESARIQAQRAIEQYDQKHRKDAI